MDIQKLFPIGHELKALVVVNPKATDSRRKFGFEPEFIPRYTRHRDRFFGNYSYEDWYGEDPDLHSEARIPSPPEETYMVIFRIDNLGDQKLLRDEEWKLQVSRTYLSDTT